MGDSIGIGHLESAFLEVVTEIKFRSADEEGTFWIDDNADLVRLHKYVAICGTVHKIHLVLEAGASAANDRDAKSASGAALL